MKKKLLIGFAAFAIASFAAFNISLNAGKSNLSMLSLANIEALAQAETGSNGCKAVDENNCWVTYVTSNGNYFALEYGRN